MSARAPLPAPRYPVATYKMIDLKTILIDQPFDALSRSARLWAGVGHSAAEPDIVAYEIHSCRILERFLHVSLLHLEMTVDISTVVRFAAF